MFVSFDFKFLVTGGGLCDPYREGDYVSLMKRGIMCPLQGGGLCDHLSET